MFLEGEEYLVDWVIFFSLELSDHVVDIFFNLLELS